MWVPREAHSKMEKERNRIWWVKESSCSGVSMGVSIDPTGMCEDRMTLRNCPKLEEKGWILLCLHQPVMCADCTGRGRPWAGQLSAPRTVPQGDPREGAHCQQHSQQLEEYICLILEDFSHFIKSMINSYHLISIFIYQAMLLPVTTL